MSNIKQYFKEYFSNKFIYRFIIWSTAFTTFLFGIVFVITANSGLPTYDAFFQPLRKLFGLGPKMYGKAILIPTGVFFCLVATAMNYLRTKTIRVDYLLGIILVIFSGFLIDLMLGIGFISDFLDKTSDAGVAFIKYPEAIGMLLGGFVLFVGSIGPLTACNIMPNNYAIIVEEISLATKRSFKFVQYAFDIALVLGGFIITIINIYVTKKESSWANVTHYVSIGTLLLLLTQSHIINFTLIKTRKFIDIINKKEGKKNDTTHKS